MLVCRSGMTVCLETVYSISIFKLAVETLVKNCIVLETCLAAIVRTATNLV